MNIIILGPPGSGKGTQSFFIINRYNLHLVSFGNILRKKCNKYNICDHINNGNLIEDELSIKIINDYLFKNINNNGYLFDGFPRNLFQAKFLNFIKINYIIEFYLDERLIFDRLLNRKIHLKSGRVYNIKYNPPIKEGYDDITGEKLITRNDDFNINIIKNRLLIYNNFLLKLRSYYKNYFGNDYIYRYIKLNSNNDINYIKKKIFNFLDR